MKKRKLKHRHFRHIAKNHIDDPLDYLDDFFRTEITISEWLHILHQLMFASIYPSSVNLAKLEFGFHFQKFVGQIEIAYIIYKQCQLRPTADPLFNLIPAESDSDVMDIDPADTISRFFGYHSLFEWYAVANRLQINFCNMTNDSTNDTCKMMIVRELSLKLAKALYAVHKNKGLVQSVHSYVIPVRL